MQSKPGLSKSAWNLIEVRAFSSIMYRHGTDKTIENTQKSLSCFNHSVSSFGLGWFWWIVIAFNLIKFHGLMRRFSGSNAQERFTTCLSTFETKTARPDHWRCVALIDDSEGNLISVPKQSIAYNSHKSLEIHSISFAAPSPRALSRGFPLDVKQFMVNLTNRWEVYVCLMIFSVCDQAMVEF